MVSLEICCMKFCEYNGVIIIRVNIYIYIYMGH